MHARRRALGFIASFTLLISLGCGGEGATTPQGEDAGPSDQLDPTPEISNQADKSAEEPDDSAPFPAPDDASPELSFTEARSEKTRILKPVVTKKQREELRDGNLNLSFELLRRLDPEGQNNLAVSALSIRYALGMVHAMAGGETQRQLTQGLGFLEDPATTYAGLNYFDQLLRSRNIPDKDPTQAVVFRSANRLFFSADKKPSPAFLDRLGENFGTGVSLVDFANQSDKARSELNAWVSKQTNQKIPELFPEGSIRPETGWALSNALYFRAPWDFHVWDSGEMSFTRLDESMVKTESVSADLRYHSYGATEDLEWTSLPLRNQRLALLVVLPRWDKFEKVRASMNAKALRSLLKTGGSRNLHVTMPKFKLDAPGVSLIPTLEGMGIKDAFADGSADFQNAVEPGTAAPARLVGLRHQVYIAVDERGVEAAGATGGEGAPKGEEPNSINFRVNRPFLFGVLDIPSGLLLFAGQVTDPS